MPLVYFITHPEVVIIPEVSVPRWPLSKKGQLRMRSLVAKDWVRSVRSIYSSKEKKAIDGAEILANHLELPITTLEALGENNRSSTGYLEKKAFEAMANQFFASPEKSIRGWERAIDAQQRIVDAVDSILKDNSSSGNIAIVSHGGVGTLLLCHLSNSPISRSMDQPGGGGGNLFCFDKESRTLMYGWQPIEDL
ncbi:MAG: phosphoglycerate mutase family protein [Verrucomicrobia bacterium]|nr:phosphoglycerate mutase family protein [Verrucomicrobiota bacterium]